MNDPAARKLTAREYADAANCPVCEEWRVESLKQQAENADLRKQLSDQAGEISMLNAEAEMWQQRAELAEARLAKEADRE